MGPKREGPIPQWGPSPLGPRPSCLSSLLDSSTGWAPPRLPHNPEKEVDVGRANWISVGCWMSQKQTFTMLSFPMVLDTLSRDKAANPKICDSR